MAGTLKPDNVGEEGYWTVNSAVVPYGDGIKNLFDGGRGWWNSPNTFNWNATNYYLDITLYQNTAIWVLPTVGYLTINAPLVVSKWNELTNSFEFFKNTPTRTTINEWEKMIELKAGRYKFAYSGTPRMDDEWFIESIIEKRYLLKSNNKTYSLEPIDVWLENKMTSNTTPAPFIASASSVFGTGYEAYKAFDGNVSNSWNTKVGDSSNQWIQLYTSKRRMITGYRMTPVSTSQVNLNQMPNTWELQGSNNGVDWKTLDKRESQKWESFEYKEYDLKVYECYLYHRLYIYSNNGHTNIVIGEISFKTSSITQLPKSSKDNFIKFGQSSLMGISSILTGKNYILQNTVSEDIDGLWKTQLNRKPLSIRFD